MQELSSGYSSRSNVTARQSQRKLASDLGIALGLVNAYLRRCVKKGLLKIGQAPARRYAYYLTPYGFAEKSRLTVEYLSSSFSFFRRAREDCSAVLGMARARGWKRIALIGVSDLAEIATICALEHGMTIAAVVDAATASERFVGTPVVKSIEAVPGGFDALVVTDLRATRESGAGGRRATRRRPRSGAGAARDSHRWCGGERGMTSNLSRRWFVAHTHPRAEAKATWHLARQGFDIYFPRYLKRRRHARKIETVVAPLFPRYLFVAVDMAIQPWRSIYSTVGIARLVCNGDKPAAVPDGIVEALKSREDADGFVKLDGRPMFRLGDKIRVLDGASRRLPRLVRTRFRAGTSNDPARPLGPQGSGRAGWRTGGRSLAAVFCRTRRSGDVKSPEVR